MTFAEKLKSDRQRLELTQVEIANLLDVPPRTYWEWEAGKTSPLTIAQEGAFRRLRDFEAERRHQTKKKQ